MNCTKCDDTGSMSKSVRGDQDCYHCGRADENTRVLAWFKSVNQGDGDADMLNLYYHGVEAGADLQRLRIMELENEIAENRKKLRGFSLQALTAAAQEMGCAAPAQQESATAPAALTDAIRDAVAENLTGLYHCGRVWSAWSVGTMGEDDFSPAEEDEDIITNIVDAVIAAIASQQKGGAS